ncbi:hypothetical protein MNEG_9296, partial [Monoraphidium neglectum]
AAAPAAAQALSSVIGGSSGPGSPVPVGTFLRHGARLVEDKAGARRQQGAPSGLAAGGVVAAASGAQAMAAAVVGPGQLCGVGAEAVGVGEADVLAALDPGSPAPEDVQGALQAAADFAWPGEE